MKEGNLSSLEVKYSILSTLEKYKRRMMLIPFGYPFNFDFMEKADEGDVVALKNGLLIRIKAKSIVNTSSMTAECISQALYGKTMKEVMSMFAERYGKDNIQDSEVILIAYDSI